ncbi:hypothetical protein [Arabiibacter massiliensis]|uniref:hypothetical protein n=1 Tax=Arabiibacter massiliensis TaxID=1870985 RepID=UPI0009BB5CD6|nr:hypothetical protein [Arabiibacter massiliensis]
MCCSDFWAREDLSLKRLPTLQELLRCCDGGLLVRVIEEEHMAGELAGLPPKRRRQVEKRLWRALSCMRDVRAGKASRTSALLPEEAFVLHAGSGLIERRVSAALASGEDASAARRALAGGRGPLPEERPYTLAPWEEALAYRVQLAGPWCARERYQVLASAFWELTFFGFEYDRATACQAQRRAALLLAEDDAPPAHAEAVGATVSEDRALRARSFGLEVPDRFDGERFDALARRVGALNEEARRDFWRRFLAVVPPAEAA